MGAPSFDSRRASFASAFIASIFDSYASFFASDFASFVSASAFAVLGLGLRELHFEVGLPPRHLLTREAMHSHALV